MSENAHVFVRAAWFLEAWIVVHECLGRAVLSLSLGVDRVDRGFLITIVSFYAWEITFGLPSSLFWVLLGAHICSFILDFWSAPLPFNYTHGLSQFLALLSQICNSFDLSFAWTKTSFFWIWAKKKIAQHHFFGCWGSSEVSKSRWRDVWAYAQLAAETNWGPEMLGQWKVFLALAVTIQLTGEFSSCFPQI